MAFRMGYPINHSTVIDLLVRSKNPEQEFNNWEKQALQILDKRIKQYSLFAVILHDPAKHRSFHKAITERFHEFKVPNPTNLLFFTLEDPPSSYKEYYQKESREYSCPDLYKLLDGPTSTIPLKKAGSTSNNFDFIFFSAGIQIDENPVVILSNDLFSSEFTWFETNEGILQDQLTALSLIADQVSTGDSSQEFIRQKIDDRGDLQQGSLYEGNAVLPLIEELETLNILPSDELERVSALHEDTFNEVLAKLSYRADVLSHDWHKSDFVPGDNDIELGNILDTLSYLLKFRPSEESTGPELNISELGMGGLFNFQLPEMGTTQSLLNNLFGGFLRKISQKIDNYTDGQNPISRKNQDYYEQLKEVLEPVSFSYLKTSFLLYNSIMSGRYGIREETDISLVAVGIGKTIENEINLSIMHYLRLRFGIELPEFFNRHRYGKIVAFYDEGPPELQADLNRKKYSHVVKNYDWQGLTLGTISHALDRIEKYPELAGLHEFFPNGNFDRLIELIYVLPPVRNAGGHPYTSITNLDIEKMFKMIWDLLESGIFHNMQQLRLKLSTNKS